MRTLVVDLSDTHGGHNLGLMSPDTQLWEEDENGNQCSYTPELNRVQRYLWDLYEETIVAVMDMAHGDDIFVLHNGDLVQGNKYPNQLVSTKLANQVNIAVANLDPWLTFENVKWMRLARGTGAHEFGEGSATDLVAHTLGAMHYDRDVKMSGTGVLDCQGVMIDYAHHGPYPGSREWLKGNVARYYLQNIMIREMMCGNKPADLYLRAHYHTPVFELLRKGEYTSRLYITPSWSFLDEHAVQATRSEYIVNNGLVVFEIKDGQLTGEHEFYQKKDIRTKEVLYGPDDR